MTDETKEDSCRRAPGKTTEKMTAEKNREEGERGEKRRSEKKKRKKERKEAAQPGRRRGKQETRERGAERRKAQYNRETIEKRDDKTREERRNVLTEEDRHGKKKRRERQRSKGNMKAENTRHRDRLHISSCPSSPSTSSPPHVSFSCLFPLYTLAPSTIDSSHLDARIVDAADAHDIVLYCLPSNTTHELQPLDKSVNKSFEHFWDEEVLLYAYQHPERKLTKVRFTKIFTKVWSKCMTKDNIISGFRATGLFPYDPSAIPEEAYAPSVLTLMPDPQMASSSRMPDSVSNSSPSRDSIPGSPVMYPRCDNHSDENFSNREEEDRNLSPSILIHDDVSPNHANYVEIVESYPQSPTFVKKLVDYSSSFEDLIMDNLENQDPIQKLPVLEKYRSTEFSLPVPTTSGLNKQPLILRLGSSTPDLSENEDFDEGLQKMKNSTKRFNIYTSSSESDEEKLNADLRKLPSLSEPNKVQLDDPEDNLPLSELKKHAEKSPFHKQIPTPNFATIKYKPRRKAVNYIGQKITKDLFDTAKEKTAKNTKRTTKKTKPSRRASDADTTKNLQLTRNQRQKGKQPSDSNIGKKELNKKKGNELKKVPRERRLNEDINKKVTKASKKKESKTLEKHGWYCHGCKVDRLDDMRQCQKCQKWYHEVCVGLTKDDEEQFICPECN
ncbi:unnamed protein product [Arctia plantaginis]|uniref:PHD-type domain-containing protein n=1 Tax=Arctia plantaginis TaxID=874455 RepID=A0A8S1B9T0_ARCPL|nr:unnamed protein product [Arctia plantaginis]